jgi:hypothetical protein
MRLRVLVVALLIGLAFLIPAVDFPHDAHGECAVFIGDLLATIMAAFDLLEAFSILWRNGLLGQQNQRQ